MRPRRIVTPTMRAARPSRQVTAPMQVAVVKTGPGVNWPVDWVCRAGEEQGDAQSLACGPMLRAP